MYAVACRERDGRSRVKKSKIGTSSSLLMLSSLWPALTLASLSVVVVISAVTSLPVARLEAARATTCVMFT